MPLVFPLLLFFTLLFPTSAIEGEAFEYFLEGEYALLIDDYTQAEKFYKKALTLQPQSPTLLKSLADLYAYQGNYDKAEFHLKELFRNTPSDKETGIELFNILIQNQKPGDAEEVLDTLLYYSPDDEEILLFKANTHYSNKDWVQLMETYTRLFLTSNQDEELLYKIFEIGIATGNIVATEELLIRCKQSAFQDIISEMLIEIYRGKGDFQSAINLQKELMESNELDVEMVATLSELYLRNHQPEEVIQLLEPVVNTDPPNLNYFQLLLIAYSTTDNIQGEIDLGRKLMVQFPEMSIGYETLAIALIKEDKVEEATGILLEGVEKFPAVITFPYSLATVHNEQGRHSLAEIYYLKTLALQPDLTSAKHSLAVLYETMENPDACDSLFLGMIKTEEGNAVSKNDYAYIISERSHVDKSQLKFALELAETALISEPENAAFLDTVGWIYYQLGEYPKAAEYLKKSLSINNENPVILEHMGDIYVKLEMPSEAVSLYKKVLELKTDNQEIQVKIRQINER
jgi:tetratricopeptide (TPR) repeat protein